MSNYIYETHAIDQRMPVILNRDTVRQRSMKCPNWHNNIELLYCISGKGGVKLNSFPCEMQPGDVVVINSGVTHAIYSEDQMAYYCLIIDSGFCRANGVDVEKIQFQYILQDEEITSAIERIRKNYAKRNETDGLLHTLEIRRDLLAILCVLYRQFRQNTQREENSLSTQRTKAIITYVRQNLHSSLSLDILSAHIGISKFHLSREFKNATGITIITFINLCRCTEAKRLIEEGTSVSDAAHACGFENLSYFTKTFKRFWGFVPSAYQNKYDRDKK